MVCLFSFYYFGTRVTKNARKNKKILISTNICYNTFYRYILSLQAMSRSDMPAEGRSAYGRKWVNADYHGGFSVSFVGS